MGKVRTVSQAVQRRVSDMLAVNSEYIEERTTLGPTPLWLLLT